MRKTVKTSNFYDHAKLAYCDYFLEEIPPGSREVSVEIRALQSAYDIAHFAAGFLFETDDPMPEWDDSIDHALLYSGLLRGRNAAKRVGHLSQLERLMLFIRARDDD
jgi:hypothetical protein